MAQGLPEFSAAGYRHAREQREGPIAARSLTEPARAPAQYNAAEYGRGDGGLTSHQQQMSWSSARGSLTGQQMLFQVRYLYGLSTCVV